MTINEVLEAEDLVDSQRESKEVPGNVIDHLIAYADQVTMKSLGRKGKLFASLLAVALMIASFASCIVDIVLNHEFTWSIVVVASCIMAAGCFIPLLYRGLQGMYLSLGLASIGVIPFLFVIEWFTRNHVGISENWALSIGVPNAICWIIVVWFCLFVLRSQRGNLWYRVGVCFLIVMLGEMFTNVYSHQNMVQWESMLDNMISVVVFVACAFGAFYVGWRKQHQVQE